ncbi:NACHT, LRR and PYD domains-containing protein 5 isoform X3 [Cucumis melo var. makuwa]|uniref:NACHT, LRR and PYD domains-containing protein 5 isoform X3 n=1 Tax=Cucumis melo var. makuwa TaxID=1194695 RepID=A0A5D3C7E3_CUCMM|nr:NACHT, LRR and PYD domains-containing protein 5 isoform X3 [Cucumis melo var. makuwa]TYK07801.1 NACHT, LRR and PYD domains-containing protein 5 isoform X3 [Cucumis melo var. makuwa]
MAEAPSLLSLCIALITDEIVQRDDVPPSLYDLPPDLLDTLALQLPPLALHNLQSGMYVLPP